MQKIHNLDHTMISLKQGGTAYTNFYSDQAVNVDEMEEIVEKPRLKRGGNEGNSGSDNDYDHLDIVKCDNQMRLYTGKCA